MRTRRAYTPEGVPYDPACRPDRAVSNGNELSVDIDQSANHSEPRNNNLSFVIPAKAGTQERQGLERWPWASAFAGAAVTDPDSTLHQSDT